MTAEIFEAHAAPSAASCMALRVKSPWLKSLPFCIASGLLFESLSMWLPDRIALSPLPFLAWSVVVSAVLMSRIHLGLCRFSVYLTDLKAMYCITKELIQKIIIFSRKSRNSTVESKQWRLEASYRTLLLLRLAVAVVQLPSLEVAPWEVPELAGQELEFCRPKSSWRRHAQSAQSRESDSLKVPMLIAYLLRESIASQQERLSHPLSSLQEDRLFQSIDSFMTTYDRLDHAKVPLTSLHQLSRVLVFSFLFAVPFFLVGTSFGALSDLITLVTSTYIFLSFEFLAEEFEAPLNDHTAFESTSPLLGAQVVFEDCFIMMEEADGQSWGDALRYKMHPCTGDPISPSELTALLGVSAVIL